MQRRTILGAGIVVLTVVAGAVAAPSLPTQLVTHWDASATADDSMPKLPVLVGGPALTAGVVLLFEVVPRIDPLGDNIREFSGVYDAVAVLTGGFVAYTYGAVLAWNLGYEFEMAQALSPAIAVLFVAVGFLLERAQRNWFVGIRTPWTLSSDDVWRRTHDRTAPLFKVAGVIALAGVVFPAYFVYLVVGPVIGISVFATVHSYVAYRRIETRHPDEG